MSMQRVFDPANSAASRSLEIIEAASQKLAALAEQLKGIEMQQQDIFARHRAARRATIDRHRELKVQ